MLARFSPHSRMNRDTLVPRFDKDAAALAKEAGVQVDLGWSNFVTRIKRELVMCDKLEVWPHYFTVMLCLIFSGSMIDGMYLARDQSVRYWIGPWGYFTLLLPWYFFLCHVLHARRRGPKIIPVILSTVVPCVGLVLLSNVHFHYAGIVADMLRAKDCITFSEKQTVHRAWIAAAVMYETCVNRTAVAAGVSRDQVFKEIRLPDCLEYQEVAPDPWASHRKTWEYLHTLEMESRCSGWCWEARTLWVSGETQDSCSASAGTSLGTKVRPICSRMFTTALIIAVLSVVSISWASRYMDHDRMWL